MTNRLETQGFFASEDGGESPLDAEVESAGFPEVAGKTEESGEPPARWRGERRGCPPYRLTIVPCSISDAKEFVAQHHRHHRPPVSGLFAVAVADENGAVRGVAVVGRPVARMAQDGWTAEVTRVATDGCANACSALYGAAWRACRALGWRKLITYTLASESGTSLRAAGWKLIGEAGGGSWSRTQRPRVDRAPTQIKLRWEAA